MSATAPPPLYWVPDPASGRLGGDGRWSDDPRDRNWSTAPNTAESGLAFVQDLPIAFPAVDAAGQDTRPNRIELVDDLRVGTIDGTAPTTVTSAVGSLALTPGARIAHRDLTLENGLTGSDPVTLTGALTLAGRHDFDGRITLDGDDTTTLTQRGTLTGAAEIRILSGTLAFAPGASNTAPLSVVMPRGDLCLCETALFTLTGHAALPSTFEGRVRMTGGETILQVRDHGHLTGTLGPSAVSGGIGNQLVSLIGENSTLTGAIRLGPGDDRLDINQGSVTGFVAMGPGADSVSVHGTLLGNLAFHTADDAGPQERGDTLLVGARGTLSGTVTLANSADQVTLFGALDGALRTGAGDDMLSLLVPSARVTQRVQLEDGNDRLHFEAGHIAQDVVLGSGDDAYRAADGAVLDGRVLGRTGNDTIHGGDDRDVFLGHAGADEITGGGGADRLYGGRGSDDLSGGAGADRLIGHRGADTLSGGAGEDVLRGGGGDDHLTGGAGRDHMTGGRGADTFHLLNPAHSGPGTAADVITDFSRAQGDRIDLRALDANTLTPDTPDTFIFSDTGLPGTAGTLTTLQEGPDTRVQGDTTGDGQADFELLLLGVTDLAADDFLL